MSRSVAFIPSTSFGGFFYVAGVGEGTRARVVQLSLVPCHYRESVRTRSEEIILVIGTRGGCESDREGTAGRAMGAGK